MSTPKQRRLLRQFLVKKKFGANVAGGSSDQYPFMLNFEDIEYNSTPSYVTGWTDRVLPEVEGLASQGYSRALKFEKGTGAFAGAGSIDLVAAGVCTAGLDLSKAFRLQCLAKLGDSNIARLPFYISDTDDETGTTATNMLYTDLNQENSPDTIFQIIKKDGTQWNDGAASQGQNYTNGNVFRYYRFEYDPGGTLLANVWTTAWGLLTSGYSGATWPVGGQAPTAPLQYIHSTGGGAYSVILSYLWMGNSTDAWPTGPA